MAAQERAKIEDLIEKLEALAVEHSQALLADDVLRRRFREASKKASIAVELPGDTIHRISNAALQVYMARVGTKLKIFEILAGSDRPLSCSELASRANLKSIDLMKRLMRYYQSYHMVSEIEVDRFAASNVTRALTPPLSSGIDYFADVITPSFAALPEWLEKNDYENAADPTNVAFRLGHNISYGPFEYLQANPDKFATFLTWMTQQRFGLPNWLDAISFEDIAVGSSDGTVLFVDVGGAAGHQCIALRERFPDVPGKVILQDTEGTIEQIKKHGLPHGIEAVAHDFFTPQTIKGARAYYMRNIMHDWPDDKCVEILQNLIPAMDENSVIVIDDMVLPETGTPWRAAQLDIAMLSCLAAKERSEIEWEALIKAAGLDMVGIHQYTTECADHVIICKPPGKSKG